MLYLILIDCNNPSQTKFFKMISNDENIIYENKEDADNIVKLINKKEGNGFARVLEL